LILWRFVIQNILRFVIADVCVAWCAVAGIAPLVWAEDQQLASSRPAQSALEAFAARPAATVVWSKTIGSLVTEQARATITALVLQDTTTTPGTISGLRIDLAHTALKVTCDWKYEAWNRMCERPNAALYIGNEQLEVVRNALEHGPARVPGCENISPWGGDWGPRGLIICGYNFAYRSSRELAALLTRGIAELKRVPR
jgi:hypothetical protein